jgi:hypothetical protein
MVLERIPWCWCHIWIGDRAAVVRVRRTAALVEDLVVVDIVEAAILSESDVAIVCGPASLKLAGCRRMEVIVVARVEASQYQDGAVGLIGVGGNIYETQVS